MTAGRRGGSAAAVAALVLLAPWWRPGALLVRDLVAVADPAWSTSLLSAGDRLPRDVPGEVLATLAGQLLPGDVVVRIVLLVALVALGAGAGHLVGHGRGAAVAGLVAVWNPYVLARLHQGQWLVVVALAALPWVVVHVRDDDRPRLVRCVVLAGCAGFLAPLVIGPTLIIVAIALRRWRALAAATTTLVVVGLPWLLVTGAVVADPEAFRAFAPNADLPLGVLPSLLTGGGYFSTAVASPWRTSWPVLVLVSILTVVAVVGAGHWVRSATSPTQRRARTAVVCVGLGTVLLAWGTATGPGLSVITAVADAVPAATVLRDSQRLIAPWIIVLAVGTGVATHWFGRVSREGMAVAIAVALLAVVALPDPLIGPRLPAPVALPAAWITVAETIEERPAPVLVVPFGQTQRYGFTAGRPVAVPLRRLVAAPVLTDTRLTVGSDGGALLVDDQGGSAALRALASAWPDVDGEMLHAAGIGWVAVTDPARTGRGVPEGTRIAVDGDTIRLVQVTGASAPLPEGAPVWLLVVDLLVALAALVLIARPTLARRRSATDFAAASSHVAAGNG